MASARLAARTTGGRLRCGVVRGVGAGGRGAVGVLAVDNPKKRNALCGRVMVDLHDAVEALRADAEVSAVLLCGAGGRFCAGAEMPTLVDGGFQDHMHDTLAKLRSAGFVTYALLEHHAVGGGAELAMAADVRMWTSTTTMQFVQTKMGITTGWGGAEYLTAAAGRANALRLLTTCMPVKTFEEAARLRLAAELFDPHGDAPPPLPFETPAGCSALGPDMLSPTARHALAQLAAEYGAVYPAAVRAVKSVALQSEAGGAAAALHAEKALFTSLWQQADHYEALVRHNMA
eukprot:TRINITY_DN10471_c0_g1_i1.p1 TRINITY_DN10471_c0_g1~~TRINITY_DN10471_c0_g1_i1.p1  ORF type:complete len:318 (+),score=101.83 TRINITY_DN10471_c0_g1_i1:88-954(+)